MPNRSGWTEEQRERERARNREIYRARMTDPAYRQHHNETHSTRRRERYADDPEHRQQRGAYNEAWRKEALRDPAKKESYLAKSRKGTKRHENKLKRVRERYAEDQEFRAAMMAKVTHTKRKRMFGVDRVAFEKLFAEQGSKCAICQIETLTTKHGWHLDHCHRTNVVRGILCPLCNVMIGMAKDNPDILAAAIAYLRKFCVNSS